MSFIQKYKPTTYDEIIGNNKKYKELEKEILKNPKKKYLIIGKSNLGKTTFINIFCKNNKYKLVNFNIDKIDDNDNSIFSYNLFIKKLVLIDIRLTNLSYNEKTKMIKKINKLIEVINKIKNTLIVIICDKNIKEYKKIKDSNINNFRMYKNDILKKHIKMIFDKEQIKYSDTTYEQIFETIIESSYGNIEKIYLNIETLMLNNKKTIRFNEKMRTNIKNTKEDIFINDTMDILNKSFQEFNLNDKEELSNKESFYYNEPFLVSSNIRENYIKLSSYKYKKNALENIDEISNTLADGDIIDTYINNSQNYSIAPYANYLNYVIPSYYLQGKYKTFFNFPSIVNKDNKILNNNKKIKKLKEDEKYHNFTGEDIHYINEFKL